MPGHLGDGRWLHTYDEIALWGLYHLPFLGRHAEYPSGTPQDDWLRTIINHTSTPTVFEASFPDWALPGKHRSGRPDGRGEGSASVLPEPPSSDRPGLTSGRAARL